MSLLEIHKLTHSFGSKTLYKEANLLLNKGEHMGIVGPNGCGKSTLIKICTEQILPDKGSVVWQPNISVGYLDQYAQIEKNLTLNEYLRTAFSELYAIEKELNKLYETTDQYDKKKLEVIAQYQEKLYANDFYLIDTKIAKISSGLGLNFIGVDKSLSSISGGQRAKVILAKILLKNPDILILDEPTNFLDVKQIDWFKDYLLKFKNAFIIVSHDNAFLNSTTNCIVDIDNQQLKKYYGSYSETLEKKQLLRTIHTKHYIEQQKEIKKTEDFIRKNSAGHNAKMAQGRQKHLSKIKRIEPLKTQEKSPVFLFNDVHFTSIEYLQVQNLKVGYYYPLLSNLNFCIKSGEKVAISGKNGVGKTTLLKTLLGLIPALDGSIFFPNKMELGYFEQELKWDNSNISPLELVSNLYPNLSTKNIRNMLATYGIVGDQAKQSIETLSGGEQSKLKLFILLHQYNNFIILDEPTNHLDLKAKEALKKAIAQFNGSVLIVSHEKDFYSSWVDKIINVEAFSKQ